MNLPDFMKKNLDIYLKNYLKQKAANCKVCNGSLIVEYETDVKNCPECIDKTEPHRKLIYSNIGMDYLDIELADVATVFTQECHDGLSELAKNIEKVMGSFNLFIHRNEDHNSYGTSTAGMILVKEMIRKGIPCYVVSCASIVDYFFGFGDKSVDLQKKEMLDFILNIPVLYINDLTHEFKKSVDKDYLYTKFVNFLGNRRLNGKFTIISTELSQREFDADYIGALAAHVGTYYLPFGVKCSSGKKRNSAEAKFKAALGDEMPALAKYLKKETPKPKDTPEESTDDILDDTPKKKTFIGSNFRGDK